MSVVTVGRNPVRVRATLAALAAAPFAVMVASRAPTSMTLAFLLVVTAAFGVAIANGDGVTLLSVIGVVTILVPTTLTVGQLGGTATPAALLGSVAALLWFHARLFPTPAFHVPLRLQPVRIAILVFAAVAVASWVGAQMRSLYSDEAGAADRGLLLLLAFVGIALFTADAVPDRERLEVLLRRIVVAVTVMAAIGLLQYLAGVDPTRLVRIPFLRSVDLAGDAIGDRAGFRRVRSTAGHAIEFGFVLTVVLPFAVHFATIEVNRIRRRMRWGCVAVMSLAIPVSLSRSAVIGLAVGMAVLAPRWTRSQRRYVVLSGVVLALALEVASPGLLGALRDLFVHAGEDPSITGRTTRWGEIGPYVTAAPVLGRGFHTFIATRYFYVDNQYVMTLVETGVVGTAALAAVFITPLALLGSTLRHTCDERTRGLVWSLIASVLVAAVLFATFDALGFAMATYLVALLVGSAGALWRLESGRRA